MRTIKFRAWSRRHEKYINPSEFVIDSTGGVFWGNVDLDKSTFEIRDWILEQYTGLKDKNGNEIYEGDILRDQNNREWLCEFRHGAFFFIPKMKNGELAKFMVDDIYTIMDNNSKAVVVGNKFEGVEE